LLDGFQKTVHVCGCYDMAFNRMSLTVASMCLSFSFFVMAIHLKLQLTLK